jgi:hypothetical protein
MFSFRTTYGGSQTIFSVDNPNSHSNGLTVMLDNTSGVTNYVSYNSYYNGNNRRANFHVDNTNSRFTHGNWNTVLVSVDTSNTNTFKAFINRPEGTPSNMTRVNAVIGFTGHDIHINRGNGAAQDPCEVANVYFSTTYTDFSQEATLNKFLDQLGYPKDLTDAISDGDIDNPIVYLKFNDLTNFGANGGTGGDLTVSGSVIQDGDVNPYT